MTALSVVIVVRQSPRMLHWTLTSIHRQDAEVDYDIVAVDETGDAQEICKYWEEFCPIRYIKNVKYPEKSLLFGVLATTADSVFFQDDCIVHTNLGNLQKFCLVEVGQKLSPIIREVTYHYDGMVKDLRGEVRDAGVFAVRASDIQTTSGVVEIKATETIRMPLAAVNKCVGVYDADGNLADLGK